MSGTAWPLGRRATLGLLLGGLAPASVRAASTKVAKLGVSAPLTGNMAQYGVDIRRGVELAVEGLNSSHSIPGVTFTIEIQDSEGDPEQAANVAQKFAAEGDVLAVIGDFSSTACLAAAPIYQKAGIIMMTPTASAPDITKTGDYIFRDTPIASTEVNATVDWGVKDLGLMRAAAICRNDDYGRSYGPLFSARSEADGAKMLSVQYFNPGDSDLKPLITGMRALKPDVVFLALFYVEAALLFQQSRDMAFHPTFMSGAGLFSQELVKLAGSSANGLLLVSAYYPGANRPEVTDFVTAYRTKFGSEPSKFAAQSYDAINLIAEAAKRAGSTTPAEVRDALAATKDYQGVIGSVSFDLHREVVLNLQRLALTNGKFVAWKQ